MGVWGSGGGVAACAEPVPALSGVKEAGGRLLVRARSPRRRDPLPGPARGGQPERGRRAPACLLRPDPGSATTLRSCWGQGTVHSGWTCLVAPRNTRYRTGLLSGDSGHLPSSREARAQRGARCRLRHREESERGLRAPSDPPGKPHSAAPQRRDLEHGPPPPQLGDGVHGGSCGRKRDGLRTSRRRAPGSLSWGRRWWLPAGPVGQAVGWGRQLRPVGVHVRQLASLGCCV